MTFFKFRRSFNFSVLYNCHKDLRDQSINILISPIDVYVYSVQKQKSLGLIQFRLLSHHKVTKKNDEPKLILLHVTYFSSVPVVANVNSYDKTMELLCDTWRHEKQLVYTQDLVLQGRPDTVAVAFRIGFCAKWQIGTTGQGAMGEADDIRGSPRPQ